MDRLIKQTPHAPRLSGVISDALPLKPVGGPANWPPGDEGGLHKITYVFYFDGIKETAVLNKRRATHFP